ncbi:hypothetical protein CCGE531_21660 (plasmid) [Rhizobium sp. CCGE531]|nr:hypothetical protein CCGE531_21660 [Rhizobium sp. CCGE531]AYG75097.1 hypothetical protein CCGE532_21145 [Rhizobium sp. CCGE532]
MLSSTSSARLRLRFKTARAIPGKVRSGFPSGIASKQSDRAVRRFREKLNRSNDYRQSSDR